MMDRENPLLHVGFTVPARGTSQEIMAGAHLDWRVDGEPLFLESGTRVGSHKALVRDDDRAVLGVVGSRYTPIQNQAMFDTLTGLVDDGEAIFTHAGSTHGGRRIFTVMQLPEVWTLERDPHVTQMLATTTHDGTGALRITPLATRVFCQNQINGFFWRGRRGGVSISHKSSAHARVEGLRAALGLTMRAMSEYEEVARTLLDVKVSEGDVDQFLARLFPEPSEESPRVEVIRERAQLARAATRSAYNGEQGEGIVGTAFGLFQAAVDYSDWSAPVRARDAAVRRAEKIVGGTDFAFKTRAYELAGAL